MIAPLKTGPLKPVTQTSECDVAATACSDCVCPGFNAGAGTTVHAVPSKCSISGRNLLLSVPDSPTAKTSLRAMAFTPNSRSPDWKCGLGTTLHFLPSKCSMSDVVCCALALKEEPTAQTSAGVRTLTPDILALAEAAIVTERQVDPLKCRATAPGVVVPTAQMLVSELPEIADRKLLGRGFGVVC